MGVNICRFLTHHLNPCQLRLLFARPMTSSVIQNVVTGTSFVVNVHLPTRCLELCTRFSVSSLSMHIGTFYPIYKDGYVSVTVYHSTYAVWIRAKFGWEGFIEDRVWSRVLKGGGVIYFGRKKKHT